ncbi:F0F1 ATP synthase subunit delta [Phreatobacter aquaticus]|uniref:ATP synthase subunit delta n=1 Tax=Phreatobacter aquaticus TaxID=2570229 RepID=A0A4D7QKA3_9HYPH|nr:F0F1 ATP synthase subunit delta [Phreatobacter aquaticus]QCK85746.1 F0F1 ATP synthase subunit delta [Phreatobacter aquaticus]
MAGEDKTVSGMAGRYALALFELASEAAKVDEVSADLDRFSALVDGSEDLKRLVQSPVFSAEDQARAVGAVLDAAKIGGIAGNLVRLVATNRRLFAIASIIRGYKGLVARSRGEVIAEVTVAEALSDANSKTLAGALKDVLGKEPKIEVKVDPAILGGLIVKVGSRMIDTSLRTKLNSIKTAMKEVG